MSRLNVSLHWLTIMLLCNHFKTVESSSSSYHSEEVKTLIKQYQEITIQENEAILMNAISEENQLIQKTNKLILDSESGVFIDMLYRTIKQCVQTPEEKHFIERFGLIVDILNTDYLMNDNIYKFLIQSTNSKKSTINLDGIHHALDELRIDINNFNICQEERRTILNPTIFALEKMKRYNNSLFNSESNRLSFEDTQILKKRYNQRKILNYLIFNNQFIFENLFMKIFSQWDSKNDDISMVNLSVLNFYKIDKNVMEHLVMSKNQRFQEVKKIFKEILDIILNKIQEKIEYVKDINQFFNAIISRDYITEYMNGMRPSTCNILYNQAAYSYAKDYDKQSNKKVFSNLIFSFCWVQNEQKPRIYFHKDNRLIEYKKNYRVPYCFPHALELYSNQMIVKFIKKQINLLKIDLLNIQNIDMFICILNFVIDASGQVISNFYTNIYDFINNSVEKKELTEKIQVFQRQYVILLNLNIELKRNRNEKNINLQQYLTEKNIDLLLRLISIIKNTKMYHDNFYNGFNTGYQENISLFQLFNFAQINEGILKTLEYPISNRYIGLSLKGHTYMLQDISDYS